MASGKPIISTIKMGYCLLARYNCGISMDTGTPAELAEIILQVHDMPKDQYEAMGRNARQAAANFDYKALAGNLVKVIEYVETKNQ